MRPGYIPNGLAAKGVERHVLKLNGTDSSYFQCQIEKIKRALMQLIDGFYEQSGSDGISIQCFCGWGGRV